MRERDWRETARLVAATVIVVLLLAFVADNRRSVPVGFVFTEREAPLFVVLLLTALLGAAMGALVRRARRRR